MKTRDFMVEVYILHEDSVLLVYEPKQNLWLPLRGHLHENELPEEAAVRTAKEELHISIELIGQREKLGNVETLVPPHTIILRSMDKQHEIVSFVFFAGPVDAHLSNIDFLDVAWFRREDLNRREIPEYVTELSLRALEEK